MSDRMKVREGDDGYVYPYTSNDLVVDENGKSNTAKFNEINSQITEISNGKPTDLSLNSTTNLLQLVNSKGSKLGNGVKLPMPNLVTTKISGTTLSLTNDKYQTATIVNGTEIVLPKVTSFTEIHLFVSITSDMTITLPACKWQNGYTPTMSANKTYEFIFTYATEWLGGVIEYE